MRLRSRFEGDVERRAPARRGVGHSSAHVSVSERSGSALVVMHPVLIVLMLFSAPMPAAYGQDAMQEDGEPLVKRITFRGSEEVSRGALRSSIETEETGCRAQLFRPLCWALDSPLVIEHRYLDREELERDVVRLRVYYFRQGYREAAVSADVVPADGGVEVVFNIEEREPTIIEEMEVRQAGDVLSSRTIRRANLLGEDDVLNLDDVDFGVRYLEQRLGSAGYLDAEVHDTIVVDRATRRADVSVAIEPGRRSVLEEFEISGNEDVDDATITQALRLKRGRVLRVNDIVAARRSLYESNLFHEVDVTVPEQSDSAKRVEVTVREAPQRVVRLGGGFNTVEFVQFESRYTHYNWLGGGRRLDIRGVLGNLLASHLNSRVLFRDVLPANGLDDEALFLRPTWQASIGFLQPAFTSAPNVLGIDLFANRRTIPGIVVDRGYGAQVSLTRRIGYDTQTSVSYAYELTSVEAGDLYFCVNYAICDFGTIDALRGSNTMSPAVLGFRSDRVDNPLAATSGYRLSLDLEHASGFTVSDFRYNSAVGEGSYYWPMDLHRRRVLAGRVRIGWVRHLAGTATAIGLDRDAEAALLHPRKRFYAGGARSVRGFGENRLGPQTLTVDPIELMEAGNGCTNQEIADGSCDPHVASMEEFIPRPVGGTALLEASVEYRFPISGGLTAALFVDGAIVSEGIGEAFSSGSRAVTPGVGVRYTTPVGPVRVDLGFRPNITRRYPVVTEYIADDGESRLVELETRRRYNAVEAAGGGFLNEIFSRLALHLSIGEAY